MAKYISLILFLLFISLFSSARASVLMGKVTGIIVMDDGNPAEGVFVTLQSLSTPDVAHTVTKTNGRFTLEVPVSNYKLLISSINVEEKDTIISVQENAVTNMPTIVLIPFEYYLDNMVVTGTLAPRRLKDTPVLTEVISGNDIRESGSGTVLEALESFIPGIVFTPNAMGDNIQMQGLDNKYILILVDGERMVNERTENTNLSRLNTADIKQIEIVSGASSVLYGSNAIGAVINITTKGVTKPVQASARVRHSSYNSWMGDASLGVKKGGFSSRSTVSGKSSDGYSIRSNPDANGTTSFFTANPYVDYALSEVLKFQHKDKLNAELKGSYYHNETWFLQKYQTRIDKNYTLGGKIEYRFSTKNILSFNGNTDKYEGHQVYKFRNDSSVFVNASQYTTFRLADVWDITKRLQLVTGGEWNIESTFSFNQFGTEPNEKKASNRNLFVQGEWKTNINLDILAGARYTHHSEFGGYVSPKLSAMYRLNNFRFRAGISNGYKAPTLKEMYMVYPHKIGDNVPFWIIGNAGLLPEEAWYESLSAEYIADKLNFSITLQNNNITNKINTMQVWNPEQNRTELRYENIEDAQIVGVDVALQWRFFEHFHVKGSYLFSDARDKATNRQLSGNARHTATLNLTFKQKQLPFLPADASCPYSLSLSARAMSPRMLYSVGIDAAAPTITETKSDSFVVCNFIYTQQFPVHNDLVGDFQFGINNLFDYINRDVFINNPGRTFFISLGVRL